MVVAHGAGVLMGYKFSPIVQNVEKDQKLASLVSLIVSVGLLAAKFWAFNNTGSQAIFSDAMESIVNVVAAILVIFVVAYASQPADRDHPYGHGKIEHLSAAFEGGLISFAALMIIIDAIQSLITGHQLNNLNSGLMVVAGAGFVNLALGYFLITVGKRKNSKALDASGRHVISDFWTSLGVVVGLFLVKWTGLVWLDSVAAIIVSLFLAKTGVALVRESMAGLLDEESEDALQGVVEVISQNLSTSVIQVHHLKMIRSGQFHHIDAHLVVPEYWDVKAVHTNIESFENSIIKSYKYNLELHFHLDPCRRAYCRYCNVPECPIRKESFEKRLPIDVGQLTDPEEPAEFQ